MNIYHLNAEYCTDRDATHHYLIEQLELPSYTGHNLDALWDVLDEKSDYVIHLYHARHLVEVLGDYGLSLLDTLGDLVSSDKNRDIILHW